MSYGKHAGYYFVNLSSYSLEDRLKKIELLRKRDALAAENPITCMYEVEWYSDDTIESTIGVSHDCVELIGRFSKE